MDKTIVALFDDLADARNVVEELVDAGIARDNISLVARDVDNRYSAYLEDRDTVEYDDDEDVGEAAAAGAVGGAVLGGLAGVLLGLGAFAIPGVGPIVAAGPIAAGLAGAGIGAATGGLLGALVEWGIPEEEAGYYAEGVRRGGTLVAVHASDPVVDDVVDIMEEYNPVDIEQRTTRWQEAGWTGYDREADPYTADQIAEYRQTYNIDEDDYYGEWEPAFRTHYNDTFASTGVPFTTYAPAYRYGYNLGLDEEYYGRDWNEIEPVARRHWETEHEGAWDQFRDAVRHGWEETTAALDMDDDDFDYDEDYDVDMDLDEDDTIEVIEEDIQVGKRQVETGGVRVRSYMTEQPVEAQVELRDEEVHVKRRPVDRPATEADLDAFKEGTIEMTEREERPVVQKEARVVEEVGLDKETRVRTETIRDTVRRTHVDIENLDEDDEWHNYRNRFQTHYDRAYTTTDYGWGDYEPAYYYGYLLGTNPSYRGRSWAELEPEARQEWEREHDSTWDDVKDAVRHAWNESKRALS